MSQSASFELARQGDLQAFNRLVAPYEDLVYGQAFYLLAQPGLAEVAAEAAFRLANRDLGSYRGSEAALKLWLLGLVTDLCQVQWAERGVRALDPKDDRSPSSSPSGAPKSGDMNGTAWDGLVRLPLEQRAALVLVDILGLDYAEAAEVLHTSAGTLAKRLAQGRLGLSCYLKHAPVNYSLSGERCSGQSAGCEM